MKQEPLVTVVTPVYNGEAYLAECIESVLEQSYRNWEYQIHDNRSTDRSLEIAQNYASKDPRILVRRHEEFVDVIESHNRAVRGISAESRYCKVLQSDDWLFPDCLEKMVAVAEEDPSIGMVGSYLLWGARVVSDGLPYPSRVLSGREVARLNLLRTVYLFWSPSAILVRSDVLRRRGALYKGNRLHADVAFYYDVLKESNFGFVHQVLAYIRKHDESVTAKMTDELKTVALQNLELFAEYGPVFLSGEQYEARLKGQLEQYYKTLARHFLSRGGGKKLWRYHRNGLDALKIRFGFAAFFRAFLIEAGKLAVHR